METYLDIEEVAKYLGIAVKTARKWVLNREIPYHKIMKVIRFRISEIDEWVKTSGKFCPITDDEPQEGELFADAETREAEKETEGNASAGGGNDGL